MRQHSVVVAVWLSLALFIGTSIPAAAQSRRIWLSAGIGTGSQQVACQICRGDRNGGWSARVAGGKRIRPHLDLGAEIHGWTDHTDGIGYRSIAFVPAIYWRPNRNRPLFLMGGVGYSTYRAANDDESITTSGLAFAAGGGMDAPLTGRWRFTPFITYTASVLANLKHDRTDVTSAQVSLLQLGLGLTRR
jgi:hypothetical protein